MSCVDWKDQAENDLEKLFDELVPAEGKAESLAGEIVRATMRIAYRFSNDGDMIGVGYGKETCNPAARFLLAVIVRESKTGKEIVNLIKSIWGIYSESMYEIGVYELMRLVVLYIVSNPELRTVETEDMYSYRNPKEDVDDDDYEEEW